MKPLTAAAVRQILGASEGSSITDSIRWESLVQGERGWLLGLEAKGVQVTMELAPLSESRKFVEVGGLQLSYRAAPGPPLVGADVCGVIAARLRRAPGVQAKWAMPEAVPSHLPTPRRRATEVPLEALGREGELLRIDLRVYEYYFGKPRSLQVAPGAYSIEFPCANDPEHPAQRRLSSRWLARPAIRDYFEDIGFRWDSSGLVHTVPTPNTLSLLLDRMGYVSGFRGELIATPWGMPLLDPTWLSHVLKGSFATPVNHLLGYIDGQTFRRLTGSHLSFTPCGMLAHDMSSHLLVVHRVPPRLVGDLRHVVTSAISARALALVPPAPVVRFYEDVLSMACQEAWGEIDNPAHFEDAILAREGSLLEALRGAIDRARTTGLARLRSWLA